jgi:serine/threonine protein kinase
LQGSAAQLWPSPIGNEYHKKRVEELQHLSRGGMGVVYLARRRADGASVAVKKIIPAVTVHPAQVERFLREVDIVRKLRDARREEAVHPATTYTPS